MWGFGWIPALPPLFCHGPEDKQEYVRFVCFQLGQQDYSFLWSDLFRGQMALLHVCTFRWRQYELQAVFLYFCIWYGTALNSFNKWLEKKLSLWERRVNLNPDFPYSSQTRLSLGQKLKLDSLTCFAQGLVQVCPLLHFSYVFLIEWFLCGIKNK